jgi:hypothetical protein
MNRKDVSSILVRKAFFSAAALVFAGAAQAQDSKTSYSSMVPIDQNLMSESAEIALAGSAPPPSISGDAAIAVLKPHGYEAAVLTSSR